MKTDEEIQAAINSELLNYMKIDNTTRKVIKDENVWKFAETIKQRLGVKYLDE